MTTALPNTLSNLLFAALGDPEFRWHSKWMFLGLLAVPLIWWRWFDPRRHAAIFFSDVSRVVAAGAASRWNRRTLLPLLRSAAVIALVVALARPQQGNEQTRVSSEGIAIQLVCDTSGSMNALDFEIDGEPKARVEVVKKIVGDFITGDRSTLAGRPNDLIGLITFARYADSTCPLTLDHGNLMSILGKVRAKNDLEAQRQLIRLSKEFDRKRMSGASEAQLREIQAQYQLLAEEDGTAIGDAIALGLERLNQATQGNTAAGKAPIKSRVMVLMTDGAQNVPDSLDPVEAAKIAVPLGIRIHTISVGRQDRVAVARLNPLTEEPQLVAQVFEVDEEVLKKVAEATGGKFFRATDTEALRSIYREIDKLERTRTDEKRYMQYTEKSGPWLLAALLCLAAEFVLGQTLLRKIP